MNDCNKIAKTTGDTGIQPPTAAGQAGSMTRIDVQSLLGAQREAILVLQGNEYRLRITSKGKLILTK